MSQRYCRINIFINDFNEGYNLINEIVEELNLTGKGTLRKSKNNPSYMYRNLEIKVIKPNNSSKGQKGHFAIYKKEDVDDEIFNCIIIPSTAVYQNIFVDEYFNKTSEYDTVSWRDHILKIDDDFSYMYNIIKNLN